ncbi:MAG: hypothetical protein GY866_04760 [Proteobacteria bacterium]|nr:hypothetical protein [Pseudomonadota bacterium]
MTVSEQKIHHKILPPETGLDFEIETPEGAIGNLGGFIRVPGQKPGEERTLEFRLTFSEPIDADRVLLHTDIRGEGWELMRFSPSTDLGRTYSLGLPIPEGGYFSFRFLLEKTGSNGTTRWWEPSDYHRLLIDPAAVENLRMYTLLPTVSGKIRDWTKTLDHVAGMGFNGLHVLPFTAMGPSESPYSTADYFSIDDHYLDEKGDPNAFADFVNRAETLGIRLCFDMVFNHVSDRSRMVREHGNWIVADPSESDGLKRAGCWHKDSWISWRDLVLIDFEHPDPAVRKEIYEYMLAYVLFWLGKAENCGVLIRLDNLHSSNETFIKWLLLEIRKAAPGVSVLSEFFGSRGVLAEGVRTFGLNLLTANTWEYPFVPMFTGYFKSIHDEANPARYYLAPTSHDTETAAQLFATPLSAIPRYFCCALMGTGQTGIVQGFEYGWEEKINFIGRQGLGNFRGDHDFRDVIAQINALLANENTFLRKGMAFVETGDDSLIAGTREDRTNGKVFLLAASFNTTVESCFTYPHRAPFTIRISHRTSVNTDENGNPVIQFDSCGVCVLQIL